MIIIVRTKIRALIQRQNIFQMMDTAFMIHYQIDEDNSYSEIDDDYCLPFPSSYPEYSERYDDCHPSGIWREIMSVKRDISKVIRHAFMKQGEYFSEKSKISNISPLTWNYMVHSTAGVIPARVKTDCMCIFHETSNGLDMSRKSLKRECNLMRFETIPQLYKIQCLLGETALAAQRKQTKTAHLEVNDTVNHVEGLQTMETPFQHCPIGHHGIDFEYDTELGELGVKI